MKRSLEIAVECIGCSAVFIFPYLINPYFYYNDDAQTYFLPMFGEISRIVRSGEFPFFTDRSWHNGEIFSEYQLGVSNPIELVLVTIIGALKNLALGAAIYANIHFVMYFLGVRLLANRIGCNDAEARLTAALACSSGWLIYWGSTDWIPALVSISYVPWAVFALFLANENYRLIPIAGFALALPALCGWPFTNVALAVAMTIWLTRQFLRERDKLLPMCATFLFAFALTAPTLLPLAAYVKNSPRGVAGCCSANWRANIDGLLSFSSPSFIGIWGGWEPNQTVLAPVYFLGWFVLIVLLHSWRPLRKDMIGMWILYSVEVSAVLSELPQISTFRWWMRLLPVYHLSLALLTGRGLIHLRSSRPSVGLTLFATVFTLALAIFAYPSGYQIHIFSACIVLVLSLLMLFSHRPFSALLNYFLFTHIAILLVLFYSHPVNDAIPLWKPPVTQTAGKGSGLVLGIFAPLDRRDVPAELWKEMPIGNRGLSMGMTAINGYTPIGGPLNSLLCFNHLSASCPQIFDKVFYRDEKTGLPLISLMGVVKVIIEKGPLQERFKREAGKNWQLAEQGVASDTFQRTDIPASPPIAWKSENIEARILSQSTRRIVIDVTNPSEKNGELILSRPGQRSYQAVFDGTSLAKKPLYLGLLPQIEVPPLKNGLLTIDYLPAGLWTGVMIGGISLLLGVLCWLSALGKEQRLQAGRSQAVWTTVR
jgi:hypothetical protein